MDERTASPILYPSEQPLRVFISSTMDAEMRPMRNEAHAAMSGASYLWPWTFEYTPASSRPADESYLGKVREADRVIWLVGSNITQAVINEIHEAISSSRPLLVFRLKEASSNPDIEVLIKEIGLGAKYMRVGRGELRLAIALSLGDELVRALRAAPVYTQRPSLLDTLGRESRARCISRWLAAGLTRLEALKLADDIEVGKPPAGIRPSFDRQLIIIQGEMGAGKSLTAERLLQEAIQTAITDLDAPVPVWLEAKSINDQDLYELISSKATGLGELKRNGALVIINGADEAGAGAANALLESARTVTAAWPNIFIVITSRPILRSGEPSEVATLEPLSEEAALGLISQVAGREARGYHWPASIKAAIKRPFWAIVMGLRLREANTDHIPRSKGELLRYLIKESLPEKSEEVRGILKRLAVLSTDRSDMPVPIGELRVGQNINDLRKTGLVVEKNGLIGFSTAILTQWFAASSIIEGEADVAAIASSSSRLDLWRYAFIIALGEDDWPGSCRVLKQVIKADPGFAMGVISEALRDYAMPGEAISIPPALEAGQRIMEATAALLEGIGPLAPLIDVARKDGRPHQIGVAVNEGLMVYWRRQDDLPADVVELNRGSGVPGGPEGWGSSTWARPTTDPAWPWRWAHNTISSDIKQLIRNHRLPVTRGPLFEELAWEEALAVQNVGSLYAGPFKIADIKARLEQIPSNASLLRGANNVYRLAALRSKVHSLEAAGLTELKPIWPGPDRTPGGGMVSSMYSADQLLERTRLVYEGAINAYIELVELWFPALKSRLQTYVTFPATLHGFFKPGAYPLLSWYFDPLARGESRVDIQLSEKKETWEETRQTLELTYNKLKKLRPAAQYWISTNYPHGSLMDMFDPSPATRIVYEWLEADLKRIGLID